ncbi:MAG: RAMP superfamily CRISPR-associated protein, partial [Thermodesulfovibrionales bacterium]|nr:RAMP superfamily CRISPR-associated protein [Thermodesulfovibrionales bacterium]
MYQLEYTLKTLSPVIIAKNSGDPNMVASEDFITGSSILGVMAELYIKKHNLNKNSHLNEDFYKWFLHGGLIFTNAYICPNNENTTTYTPTPFSIQRPKADINERVCYDLLFEEPSQPTTYLSGFCEISDSVIYKAEVKKTIHFHHERDYQKGSTKQGIIFNYEAISEEQVFKGMILSKDKSILEQLLKLTGDTLELNIGKSRSVQYGKVIINLGTINDFTTNDLEATPDGEFSLTFTSSAILLNEHGFCSTDIQTIKHTLGVGVEIIKAFLKPDEYEGFNSVWGVKKPSQQCIAAGSCLLIKTTEEALNRLKTLQFTGIGQRTNEGFGRFVLWMQKAKQINLSSKDIKIKKPKGEMPDEVKKICKSLINEYIIKNASLNAIDDAKQFCKNNPPTKSLISSLELMVKKTGELKLKLRPLAMNKLENCNNGDVTLKEYLEDLTDFEILKKVHLPSDLISETGYKP